ncbi:MAG: hypothetical protein IPI67_15910 [Myxococcales bacterium]|nr:hypothetical protein [Myxococcales bacterium]
MSALESWNVLPHGPVVELAENLRCVEGPVPGMALKRRMTLIKRESGGLVIHGPMLIGDAELKQIEAWAEPELLVVPNGFHRLDIARFKRRYPNAKVVCPAGAKRKVEQKAPVDLTYAEVPEDAALSFEHLAGVKEREGVLRVRSRDGLTLVFNDALFNVPHQGGMHGLILRWIGSSGGPRVTLIARTFLVDDKPSLRACLEKLSQEQPVRLIPGHGDLIDAAAPEVLREVAGRL